MRVLASIGSSTASLLLCLSALPAIAEDAPCTCPDMLDLASRNNQVKAAMQTYQEQLAAWTAAGAPGADVESRTAFQLDIVEPPSRNKAIVNFAPRQIGKFMSQVLTRGDE